MLLGAAGRLDTSSTGPSRRSRRPTPLRLRSDRGRRAVRRGVTSGAASRHPPSRHSIPPGCRRACIPDCRIIPAQPDRRRRQRLRLARALRLGDPHALDAWIRSIEPSPRSCAAVRLLTTRPVDEVAATLGVTGRHLRRIVLAEVELAPEVYQQVVRLQRFVRAVDDGEPLAAAAAAAGYADQPHLTRDVRRFSGLTPGRLASERRT